MNGILPCCSLPLSWLTCIYPKKLLPFEVRSLLVVWMTMIKFSTQGEDSKHLSPGIDFWRSRRAVMCLGGEIFLGCLPLADFIYRPMSLYNAWDTDTALPGRRQLTYFDSSIEDLCTGELSSMQSRLGVCRCQLSSCNAVTLTIFNVRKPICNICLSNYIEHQAVFGLRNPPQHCTKTSQMDPVA